MKNKSKNFQKPFERNRKKPAKAPHGKAVSGNLVKTGTEHLIWGTHAAEAAWMNPARTIKALYITDHALEAFKPVMERAAAIAGLTRPAPVVTDRKTIDKMIGGDAVHQGLVLDCAPLEEVFINDLIIRTQAKDNAVIVMLDQVTDPHNVGAILRSACAFGAGGLVMQRKFSPSLCGALAKIATGAVEYVPVAYEINLADTIDKLRVAGFNVYGLDERGDQSISTIAKTGKTVIVLGAEGKGLRPKVRDHCDMLVQLPTAGPIASLNVSNAAAIALFALRC